MRIAVYSGSFDPLHIGHLAVMERLEGLFDETYLVVSPQNPLKDPSKADNAFMRLSAARIAIANYPRLHVHVEDIEFTLPSPQYTIHTLDALAAREPENTFTHVMGADCLADIRRWSGYARILCEYGVAVYPRKGYDLAALKASLEEELPGAKITVFDAPLVDMSSTWVNAALAKGEDVSRWVL